jgi:hypothetical protein
MPRRLYVTFSTNDKFCKLCETTVRSIHMFTNDKIIMYCVGFSKPKWFEKYDNLICRELPDVKDKRRFLMRYKPIIMLDVIKNDEFDEAMYIESDEILIKEPSKLFENCKRIKNIPLAAEHDHEPNHYCGLNKIINGKRRYKTTPFLHSCMILFTHNCKEFIENWLNLLLEIQKKSGNHRISDEVIFNISIWKNGFTDYVKRIGKYPVCAYPYPYSRENGYTETKIITEEHIENLINNENIYLTHGCKINKDAIKILDIAHNFLNKKSISNN